MFHSSHKESFYPTIYESIIIILLFIFLSLITGALVSLGGQPDSKIKQDLITLLGYVVSAGGTLLIITRFKKLRNPQLQTFHIQKSSLVSFLFTAVLTMAVIVIIEPLTTIIPMPEMFKEILSSMFSKTFPAFITAVIAAPILEELIFRGIILEGLLRNYNPLKAIIITNVLFGVAHLNPWQFIGAFFMGIFISWIYLKTRNLLLPVFIHLLNNLISYLAIYYSSDSPFDTTLKDFFHTPSHYYLLIAISLIVLVLGVFYSKKFLSENKTSDYALNNIQRLLLYVYLQYNEYCTCIYRLYG
jgi:hypothetical protein